MSKVGDVLPAVGEGELEDGGLNPVLTPLNDIALRILEAVDVHDFDGEVELGDKVLADPGPVQLRGVVENYLLEPGLPFLCIGKITLFLNILTCAEKYSYPCSDAISYSYDSLSLRYAW